MNPFARGGKKLEDPERWTPEDPAENLEPGPSTQRGFLHRQTEPQLLSAMLFGTPLDGNFLELDPHTLSAAAQATVSPTIVEGRTRLGFSDAAVQTEQPEESVEADVPRKGSLSKLKGAGRVIWPRRGIRYVVDLVKVKHKRSAASASSRSRSATPAVSPPPKPVPERPPRPDVGSNFIEVLEIAGNLSPALSAAPSLLRAYTPASPGDASPALETPETPATSLDSPPPPPPVVHNSRRRAPQSPAPPVPPEASKGPLVPIVLGLHKSKPDRHHAEADRSHRWCVTQRNNLIVPSAKVTRWAMGGLLGDGGFGRVYLVLDVNRRNECAMKVISLKKRLSASACRGIINELRVLAMIAHEAIRPPFLLLPYTCGSMWAWRSSPGYLHILTEVCPGGVLAKYNSDLTFYDIMVICAEVVRLSIF